MPMKLNMKLIYKTIDGSSNNRVFIQANSNSQIIQICKELLNKGLRTGHYRRNTLLSNITKPGGNTYALLTKCGDGSINMFSDSIVEANYPILEASAIILNKPAKQRRAK